jgi:hypothetical protein
MTTRLPMEVRSVDVDARTVEGVCVPWDETSYLTPNPAGERMKRGAFNKSITQRGDRIFLYRDHDHSRPVGRSESFSDQDDGLHGTFRIRESVSGNDALVDLREGYLPALSIGFRPLNSRRGPDGATEITEAQLLEVSLVSLPAYDGARVLALRTAWNAWHIPASLDITENDLSPTMPGWLYGYQS